MNAVVSRLLVCVLTGIATSVAAAVQIETVPVGNPGNAADTRVTPGIGSISYTYNIGKYEVTADQYAAFLNSAAGVDTYGLYNPNMSGGAFSCGIVRSGGGTVSNPYTYSVDSAFANRPVSFVSWANSARFVNWLHNGQPAGPQIASTTEHGAYDLSSTHGYYGPNGELPSSGSSDWYALNEALTAVTRQPSWRWAIPTEDEWHKAAQHKNDGVTGNYWDYPTRSNSAPGRDLNDDSGNNANYYGTPFPIDSPQYTTLVGQFRKSASPYGTFDQGGNVLEWNETAFSRKCGLRGGSFATSPRLISERGGRSLNFPTAANAQTGFRVVQLPEPASLAIVTLAGGLLVRRREGGK